MTLSAVAATAGLTGAFTAAAAYTFAQSKPAPAHVPQVPMLPTPQQSAPPSPIVEIQVVHHSGYAPGTVVSGGGSLRPPSAAPGAAPLPPPAPVCVSTPSKPCP